MNIFILKNNLSSFTKNRMTITQLSLEIWRSFFIWNQKIIHFLICFWYKLFEWTNQSSKRLLKFSYIDPSYPWIIFFIPLQSNSLMNIERSYPIYINFYLSLNCYKERNSYLEKIFLNIINLSVTYETIWIMIACAHAFLFFITLNITILWYGFVCVLKIFIEILLRQLPAYKSIPLIVLKFFWYVIKREI